jgi:RNA-binding protein YhbY
MPSVGEMQLGKNGVTENFLGTLRGYFSNHGTVKVSVLRSAPGREDMKKLSANILEKLGDHYTARVIGFTLAIKKWRRARE